MNKQTADTIKSVIFSSLLRTLQRREIDEPYDPIEFKLVSPFYARLVPDAIWRASRFERSFVTSIGQGVFEQVAVIIATGAGSEAIQNHRESGELWTGQLAQIQNILSNLRGNLAKPDWYGELASIANARGVGEKVQRSVIADLYIRKHDGVKHFYSLKTVKPNLDQTEKAKSDLLTFKAIHSNNLPYFALPYNPYITRQAYNWSQPFKIFDMRQDPCVLIGEEFWDDVGGEGTYTDLLNIFEESGQEFAPRIQAYLEGLNG
jgi:Type II restriction endonuclease, TdeIII